jgi:hypothetical protein
VHPDYYDLEMIGFTDRFAGWTGGRKALFKTTDGGQTWTSNLVTDQRGFNRFFRVSDKAVYLSGYTVYRLRPNALPPGVQPPAEHTVRVIPNPVKGSSEIELNMTVSTFAELSLYTLEGKKLTNILREHISGGITTMPLNLNAYSRATYLLVLKTNEGISYTKVIKQ